MPPTTSGICAKARGAHPVQHFGDQRQMAARQDRQADDMRLLIGGGADDLGRGQADAFVMDVHAAIAGAGGDLFGAVGMAVKAGLADEEFQPAAQFGRNGGDGVADRLQPFGAVRRVARNAGGGAVFAKGGAHHGAPFAGGDAGLGGGDRGGHDVGARRCAAARSASSAALTARLVAGWRATRSGGRSGRPRPPGRPP